MHNTDYHHQIFLPSCAFQKTMAKTVCAVKITHRLSKASSIVAGMFLDLSGTRHSVAMAGAALELHRCLDVHRMFTPNRRQLMRHSKLNRYIFGLEVWTWMPEAHLSTILDAKFSFFFFFQFWPITEFYGVYFTIVEESPRVDSANVRRVCNVCNNVFCAAFIIGIERPGVESFFF